MFYLVKQIILLKNILLKFEIMNLLIHKYSLWIMLINRKGIALILIVKNNKAYLTFQNVRMM